MKYQPIEESVTIPRYKCPVCGKTDLNKDWIKNCGIEHEFKDLSKEVEFWGNTAKFISKEQAERFSQLLWHGGMFENSYRTKVEWAGEGTYYATEYVVIGEDYEEGTKHYERTFRKRMY